MSAASPLVPPLSAAEALSALLWQPYECRSPPLARSRTDGALAERGGAQSPSGGRHARAPYRSTRHEMRLPVPAEAVSVRVPADDRNVSSVIVQVQDAPVSCNANVNSAVQTERERSVASAECQTEEPARRRRARRARAPRAPELLEVPPPPYSTLPPPPLPLPSPPAHALPVHAPPAPIIAPHPPAHRFPFQPIPLRSGRGAAYACSEGEGNAPKSCCGRPPLRLCVLFLGVAGACLVAAGAVLGALRPHPRAPLTLLLLMIGIGVVLVTAAGLAWRLGARDAPCALLGLRRGSCRRLVRLPPSYARPHHPYAAMLYPEFHYRPPPPTYQASMQEYRLRLLLLDRSAPAVSPPPTYRSNSASLVRGSTGGAWCGSEYSGPPSYRAPRAAAPVSDAPLAPLDLKYAEDTLEPLPKPEHEKDPHHLVTIVHTDAQPVIVTVSGSAALNDSHAQPPTEIDILAHL